MSTEKFTIVVPGLLANKIAVIKAIRTLTGLGLKEAKDASEFVGTPQTFILNPVGGPSPTGIGFSRAFVEEQYRILRAEGVQVGESVFVILDDLRKLGSQALLQGEDELANEILQLVLAEKLRRGPQTFR